MRAYVELVQRREREIGCDVLTHQKVSYIPLALPELTRVVVRRRLCRRPHDDRYRRNVSLPSRKVVPADESDQLIDRRDGCWSDREPICSQGQNLAPRRRSLGHALVKLFAVAISLLAFRACTPIVVIPPMHSCRMFNNMLLVRDCAAMYRCMSNNNGQNLPCTTTSIRR